MNDNRIVQECLWLCHIRLGWIPFRGETTGSSVRSPHTTSPGGWWNLGRVRPAFCIQAPSAAGDL